MIIKKVLETYLFRSLIILMNPTMRRNGRGSWAQVEAVDGEGPGSRAARSPQQEKGRTPMNNMIKLPNFHEPRLDEPRTMTALGRQLAGYRLTTAEITYHMPDFGDILQTFIWQDLDLAPRYPVLAKFLNFWETKLDGRLHSVRVGSRNIVSASEIRAPSTVLTVS